MKIIEKIELKNYKSILSEEIDLEDKTALIGANESGKSNILAALNHLEENTQKKFFEAKEQNISIKYNQSNMIKISYHICLTNDLIPDLLKLIPEFKNCKVILSKTGIPKSTPTWSLEITKPPKFGNLAIITAAKTTVLSNLRKNGFNNKWIEEHIVGNNFIGGGDIRLSSNPFYSLIQEKKIKIFKDEEKLNKIENLIKEEILKNIQIYFWKYEPESYLTESISLEDYCNNWNKKKYEIVTGIIKIAKDEGAFDFDITTTNLRKFLIETDKTSRSNLLEKRIAKKFNKVFNKSWKTYWGSPIKLKLNYEETDLTFRFDDGHDVPPEFRSDGFKWFLTFMINFQSKEKSLSNYLLLIDEPGGNLHPRGQKDALAFINKLNKKNQIVYSTHQTFLIDKNQPESIRILDRTKKDSKNDFYPTRAYNIKNQKTHILKDDLLRESLGFTLSDISPINEMNILVEGAFDRSLLQLCNQKYKVLDMNNISILECGKATNIRFSADHYLKNGLKVICIYDSDSPGKNANENNVETPDKYKIFISDKSNQTIEDLIPQEIFQEAYEFVCSSNKEYLDIQIDLKKPFMEHFKRSLKKGIVKDKIPSLKHMLEDKLIELTSSKFTINGYLEIQEKLIEIKRIFQ